MMVLVHVSRNAVAALASGGLDSGVMLNELAKSYEEVFPVYVRCGLRWENDELAALREFVKALGNRRVMPISELYFPMNDVYGVHWSTGGETVPAYDNPDEDWEIPGRNLVLVAKTAVWCKLQDIRSMAMGVLKSNPFSDATPEFFTCLQEAITRGLHMNVRLVRPLENLHKADIIRLGRSVPLGLTLSCADPVGMKHCGRCGKCRERINAFIEADVVDPTEYAQRPAGKNFGRPR